MRSCTVESQNDAVGAVALIFVGAAASPVDAVRRFYQKEVALRPVGVWRHAPKKEDGRGGKALVKRGDTGYNEYSPDRKKKRQGECICRIFPYLCRRWFPS